MQITITEVDANNLPSDIESERFIWSKVTDGYTKDKLTGDHIYQMRYSDGRPVDAATKEELLSFFAARQDAVDSARKAKMSAEMDDYLASLDRPRKIITDIDEDERGTIISLVRV